MKKILIIIVSALLLTALCGCKSEITADDVSKAIADIYSDNEGNVTIALSDGREFNLGNMKGEKGDKGDKGDKGAPGINGIDGKDGINGKDGVDGKDGTNGSDGKDGINATPITDYVKDVSLTDENMLTIEYGDGSTSEVSRIDLEGQYIVKVYVDLYDLNNNYVTTVLYNYLCYEEGDTRHIYIEYPFEYSNKTYAHLDFGTIPDDITITHNPDIDDEGPYFNGIMPGHNTEYHFKAKEISYNPVGEIKFTSSDINDVKTTLDSFGITYTVSNGDASLADCGKVQKVSIAAVNGQIKELNINGEGWSSNFLGASATIYTYKEPTLSVTVLTNNQDKITCFTAIYSGIDDVDYTWYDGDSEIGTGRNYIVPESQTMNSIKLVARSGDKSLEASYSISN